MLRAAQQLSGITIFEAVLISSCRDLARKRIFLRPACCGKYGRVPDQQGIYLFSSLEAPLNLPKYLMTL